MKAKIWDLLPNELKEKICQYNNSNLNKIVVNPENIVLGNGIDELLFILFTSINEKNSKIIVSIPTYPDYKNYANSVGVDVIEIPLLKDFQLDVDKIIKKSKDKNVKLIIICNPNNPTGNIINFSDIYYILENIKDKLVLIDEAYFEFSNVTLLKDILLYPNLIIARSFSKGFLSPGLRLGYFIGQTKIISELYKVKTVYNLSNLAQFIGIKYLNNSDKFKKFIDYIIKIRDYTYKRLSSFNNITPYQSHTNFILFRCSFDANKLYNFLLENNISLRNVSKAYNLNNCLRISLSLKENIDLFLNLLENFMQSNLNYL